MATDETLTHARHGARPRIFAAVALLGFLAGLGYAGREGYRAATDSFVAPIILSPDNDVVIANKAKMAELNVQRATIMSDAEAVEADLAAGDRALARLRSLQQTTMNALSWTKDVTAHQASAAFADLKTLAEQTAVLREMADRQDRIARTASENLAGSLISKNDEVKEQLSLNQVQLALLDNKRTRAQSELAMRQLTLAQRSLASGAGTPQMPEAVAREEQLVRIELEILRIESEQRSRRSLRKLVLEKLANMDAIEGQLKARPLFRATEKSLDVAFVPYTQSGGVGPGANVYDCVWGIFHCKAVGTIAEIVPGEVVLPDPWGNQARGQYAILALSEHESAKAKVLRVRVGAPAAPAVSAPQVVSAR